MEIDEIRALIKQWIDDAKQREKHPLATNIMQCQILLLILDKLESIDSRLTQTDDRPTGSLYGHAWGEPNDG